MRTQRTSLPPSSHSSLYLSTRLPCSSVVFALMSCTIHDRCTCYGASLQYTASMATATSTGSSQFAPQANNIFIGYEWAAPLVTTSSAWYPLESVIIQPPTSHAGQDMLQSECHPGRLGTNTHEAPPLHNPSYRESCVHERGLKQAPSFRDQVRLPISRTLSRA